jgi:hypothetical protein
MYILYLDDSGSAGNTKEDYFVLGGVCVYEASARWLSYEVERIAEELCPADPGSIEFHAASEFNGRDGIWKTLARREDRIKIIQRVLHVLDNANPDTLVFACAVHKPSYPKSDPVELAFEELTSRFNLFLSRCAPPGGHSPKGMVVLDKTTYETSLQKLAADFRREGNRWGSYLKNICDVPLFIDSTASRNIQLADHIAYAVYRRYNAGDLTYFNCFEGHFHREADNGTIHSLVHKHQQTRSCLCPACITRR